MNRTVSWVLALTLLPFTANVALANDHQYLGAKADPDLAIYFVALGGENEETREIIFSSWESSYDSGVYTLPLPEGINLSDVKVYCASILEPPERFGEVNCVEMWDTGPPEGRTLTVEIK